MNSTDIDKERQRFAKGSIGLARILGSEAKDQAKLDPGVAPRHLNCSSDVLSPVLQCVCK
jgi:hypothetical protein